MRFLSRLFGPTVTDAEIIDAMDPWTLACASGAENGSLGVRMGFDWWLSCSRKNWVPQVTQKTGVSARRIESVLRGFVSRNSHKPYQVVLREEEQRRGQRPSAVLGPGESMTVTLNVPLDLPPLGHPEIHSDEVIASLQKRAMKLGNDD